LGAEGGRAEEGGRTRRRCRALALLVVGGRGATATTPPPLAIARRAAAVAPPVALLARRRCMPLCSVVERARACALLRAQVKGGGGARPVEAEGEASGLNARLSKMTRRY
jgi:hypothetical protein